MMPRISFLSMLVALSLLGTSRAAPSAPEQASAEARRIQGLIHQLSSDEFPEREKAARQLEQIGSPALELLQKAARSGDLDFRRTVEELASRIQAQHLAALMLVPRKVTLDLKDVPVAEAVALLSRQSGYAIQVAENQPGVADQKITLQVRDLPFWEVLGQLCRQAELTEQRPAAGAAKGEILHLTRARGEELASGQTGSVRLGVLPAARAQIRFPAVEEGEGVLILDALAEPRLKGFGMIGIVRVQRAVDDQGQDRDVVHLTTETPPVNTELLRGGGGGRGGRPLVLPPEPALGQRQVALCVRPAEKPARVLRELSGFLSVQTYRELEEDRIVVNNILEAGGTTCQGKKGEEIEIQDVTRWANGGVQIQLLLRNVTGPNQGGLPVAVMRGRRARVVSESSGALDPAHLPQLLDAQGRAYHLAENLPQGIHLSQAGIAHQVTLVYRPAPGQKDPARLVLRGQQLVVFEVPFTLKNVPLP